MPIVAHQTASDKSLHRGTVCQQEREDLRQDVMVSAVPLAEAAFNRRLEAEVTAVLGRSKGQHRASLTAADSPVLCPACSRHATLDFLRHGHYQRTLLTMWGWLGLQVPRIACVCGHCPPIPFAVLDRYDRLWSDLDAAIIQYTALALSLRAVSAVLELQNGHVVSIGAVQRRVGGASVLAAREMAKRVSDVPPVIMLDALWGTFMAETGERKRDKRQRLRRVKKRQTVPVLVAYGVDPQTGEKRLLAWAQGKAESADDWERLLSKLHERGVHHDSGLRLVIHDGSSGLEAALEVVDFGPVRRQRCIFHKLRNVLRDVVGHAEMTRDEKRERIKAVLSDACAVYEAPTAEKARQRAAAFRARWGAAEPKAVATMERDFEQTLTYYGVMEEAQAAGQTWVEAYLRTTSGLERFNRGLRAKWRQAGAFWSEGGLMAAFWLVAQEWADRDKTTRTGWIPPILAQMLDSG